MPIAYSFDFLKVILAKEQTNLAKRDAAVIWHPYTPYKSNSTILNILKGEGVYLIDDRGIKYIDAISSWWTNLHGHSHHYIANKIHEQAQRLEHVIFAGCTHEPAVQLAERLVTLLPGNFSKVFFSDDGSTAVEVALKMAIQYWKNQDAAPASRNKILAFRNAYHGDTFGAMSVSERGPFNKNFDDYLFEVIFIDTPTAENIIFLKSQIEDLKSKTAAFIYEPLVQGAGGMKMYDAENMNNLLKIIKLENIICIADEVMTGFGRTGKLFASEYIEEKPDIICLSKGLTGGALPMAISACNEKVFESFKSNDLHKTFFHGHSYTGNPLACSAALASLDLLQQNECLQNIQYISESHKNFVHSLTASQNQKIINARSLGTILAFEVDAVENNYLSSVKETIMKLALEQGVLLRPLGNTIYIMPPYCITPIQLEKVYACIHHILAII